MAGCFSPLPVVKNYGALLPQPNADLRNYRIRSSVKYAAISDPHFTEITFTTLNGNSLYLFKKRGRSGEFDFAGIAVHRPAREFLQYETTLLLAPREQQRLEALTSPYSLPAFVSHSHLGGPIR